MIGFMKGLNLSKLLLAAEQKLLGQAYECQFIGFDFGEDSAEENEVASAPFSFSYYLFLAFGLMALKVSWISCSGTP
jgi:hypothetical protein